MRYVCFTFILPAYTDDMQFIMSKIKERNGRRAPLSNHKSAAAQARMKSIASPAVDERVPNPRNGEKAIEVRFPSISLI